MLLRHIIIFTSQSWDLLIRTYQEQNFDLQSIEGQGEFCLPVFFKCWSRGWVDGNHWPWECIEIFIFLFYPEQKKLKKPKQPKSKKSPQTKQNQNIGVITHKHQFNYLAWNTIIVSCHDYVGVACVVRWGEVVFLAISLSVICFHFFTWLVIFDWMHALWIFLCWVPNIFVLL